MNSTNITHQMYADLVRTNSTVLHALEQVASQCPVDKARECLSALLREHSLVPNEPLDYLRLYALLKKDLSGQDLSREDFRGMPLEGFTFAAASLDRAAFDEADLYRANLCDSHLAHASFHKASCGEVKAKGAYLYEASLLAADWSEADCSGAMMARVEATEGTFTEAKFDHADLSRADFSKANLSEASFAYCNLEEIRLEGANLFQCGCATAFFGKTLCFDANTNIDPDNHTLISMVLLSRAQSVEEQKFALYIRHKTNLCWPGFTRLLLRQRGFVSWVKETLDSVNSLKERVAEYEAEFQRLLEGDQNRLYLADIHPVLHQLFCAEIDQHASLPRPDLYWYLYGGLELASRQPDINLDEQQKQAVLERLRNFTNMPSK